MCGVRIVLGQFCRHMVQSITWLAGCGAGRKRCKRGAHDAGREWTGRGAHARGADLFGVNVKGSAGQVAALQRLCRRLNVHHAAAGSVDEVAALFHLFGGSKGRESRAAGEQRR